MSKTAQGLVEYATAQLGKPYWWGTYGNIATAELLASKRKQYPSDYASYGSEAGAQMGQKVHDCVGLIKGYLWCDTPDGKPKYNGAQDVAVSGLYASCTEKGGIATMPDEPGVCVFQGSLGHVGVYIGNGYVVEAMGHDYGVRKTSLNARGWAYWGKPKWIEYSASAVTTPESKSTVGSSYTLTLSELSRGSEGEQVKSLQRLLISLGYDCGGYGPDGEFGEGTEDSVKSYQINNSLTADGIAGKNTMSRLLGIK